MLILTAHVRFPRKSCPACGQAAPVAPIPPAPSPVQPRPGPTSPSFDEPAIQPTALWSRTTTPELSDYSSPGLRWWHRRGLTRFIVGLAVIALLVWGIVAAVSHLVGPSGAPAPTSGDLWTIPADPLGMGPTPVRDAQLSSGVLTEIFDTSPRTIVSIQAIAFGVMPACAA
jgi:hypothetical protein